ncbi:hypothetical protein NECAME_02511 [Necator americanus]|uniref:Uncharacterized protein n=1 Tax=Necator americanus TaxID=51031 RepID=W2TG88_NECAM|nr:hypothetical protein NECAME_02511 [Necator americanus]ETN80032.1 hypothetical protein NECAME_02511 [Necator americanus]
MLDRGMMSKGRPPRAEQTDAESCCLRGLDVDSVNEAQSKHLGWDSTDSDCQSTNTGSHSNSSQMMSKTSLAFPRSRLIKIFRCVTLIAVNKK